VSTNNTNAAQHVPQVITESSRALLGESPVWDERTQTLYWVDIERGELHQCQADGSIETSLQIGERIGCIALRRDRAGFIAGLERSIALIILNPLEIHRVAMLDENLPSNRCNDGKCDAAGRFWVGTCDTRWTHATGWIYRFDATRVRRERSARLFVRTGLPFLRTAERSTVWTALAKSSTNTILLRQVSFQGRGSSGNSTCPGGAIPTD